MRTFKTYTLTKLKKKEEGAGLAPAPIHFKHIEELSSIEPKGVMPTAVHFKNILTDKKQKLNEAKAQDFRAWMKDRSDNAHLSKKKFDRDVHNKEVADKLHSTNNFSAEHLKHITKYTGDPDNDGAAVSSQLNKSLIKNKGEPSKAHKKTTEGLSHAIENNKLNHEVHVYSGTSFDPREHIDKKGKLKSHAFISATHDKEIAAGYAQKAAQNRGSNSSGHIMKIHLKPGDPATHVGRHSYYNGEHETVINRNTTLKHEKTTSHWSPGEERYYHIHHMSVAKD